MAKTYVSTSPAGPLGRALPDMVHQGLVVRPRVVHGRRETSVGRPPADLRHDDPYERGVDGVEEVGVGEAVAVVVPGRNVVSEISGSIQCYLVCSDRSNIAGYIRQMKVVVADLKPACLAGNTSVR